MASSSTTPWQRRVRLRTALEAKNKTRVLLQALVTWVWRQANIPPDLAAGWSAPESWLAVIWCAQVPAKGNAEDTRKVHHSVGTRAKRRFRRSAKAIEKKRDSSPRSSAHPKLLSLLCFCPFLRPSITSMQWGETAKQKARGFSRSHVRMQHSKRSEKRKAKFSAGAHCSWRNSAIGKRMAASGLSSTDDLG